MRRRPVILLIASVVAIAGLWALGSGHLGESWHAGTPNPAPVPPERVRDLARARTRMADVLQVEGDKQILFGDLHVHTTFSADAFQMGLPMAGGDGAHPVADACDFARHCATLDFWSINDHAISSTPRRRATSPSPTKPSEPSSRTPAGCTPAPSPTRPCDSSTRGAATRISWSCSEGTSARDTRPAC